MTSLPKSPKADEKNAYSPSLPQLLVDEAVRAALLEDFGRAGDITSAATIAPDARAVAILSTREDGVLAGVDLSVIALRQFVGGRDSCVHRCVASHETFELSHERVGAR